MMHKNWRVCRKWTVQERYRWYSGNDANPWRIELHYMTILHADYLGLLKCTVGVKEE